MAYLFWFVCQLVMLIILLNFVIAVISDTYARVSEDREIHTYKYKAMLNSEAYTFFENFYRGPGFQAIIITSEKKLI